MVLNKLTFKMDKYFQQNISNFLRKEDIETSSLL